MPNTLLEFLATYFTSNRYTTQLTEILSSVGTNMNLYIIEIKENKFYFGESDDTENSCYLQVVLGENKDIVEFTLGNYTQSMEFSPKVNTEKIQKILEREGVLNDNY